MPQPNKLGGKRLTEELRKLAAEAVSIDDNGDPITREQALSLLIWQQALGWEEKVRDEHGSLQVVKHPPVAWAQQFLWERMEGKAPVAQAEAEGHVKAKDKVDALARNRLNAMAGKTPSGPPPHKPKQ